MHAYIHAQWRIQRVFDTDISVWGRKLCAQINEKRLKKTNLFTSLLHFLTEHCKTFEGTLMQN